MTTNPELIIFDLDDTLIDFNGSISECWQRVYDSFCSEFPHIPADQFHKFVREYADWYWSDPERHRVGRLDLVRTRCEIVAEALRRLGTDDTPLAYRMGEYYTSERDRSHILFPEALDVLDHLVDKGQRLAMITNGKADMQRRKIDRFNLAPYFHTVLVEGEFGIGKPDERVYRHVLNQTGVEPQNAWMVGDNIEWDVLSPMRLGITGIWFNPKGRDLPSDCYMPPDRIIRTLRELI